ncbi:MAG: 2-oxoglutarate synthase [Deltaproteobacteria bacterium]|nr:2-oxoglutarate synthase [Deltaproteobacteria bacterium]
MTVNAHPLREKYTRSHVARTTTCPGCGIGTVSQAILRAIDGLQLDIDDFVFVSGIGCSAWIPSPFYNADTLHTTHGRPIAFATGVKLGLPHKHVMVVSGDGDLTAIGTTPRGIKTITSPYGAMEPHFDVSAMVSAAGASYVARWTTHHPRQMSRAIRKGIEKEGFALIEAVSQCPVQFGRASKIGGAVEMLKHFKENSVRRDKALGMDPEQLAGKIVVGEFADRQLAELTAQWARLRSDMAEGS